MSLNWIGGFRGPPCISFDHSLSSLSFGPSSYSFVVVVVCYLSRFGWLTGWLAATKDNCIVWSKSTNQSSDPSSDDDFRTLFRFIVVLRRLGGFVRIVLAANEREVPLIIPSTTVATLFFVENVWIIAEYRRIILLHERTGWHSKDCRGDSLVLLYYRAWTQRNLKDGLIEMFQIVGWIYSSISGDILPGGTFIQRGFSRSGQEWKKDWEKFLKDIERDSLW